MIRTIAVLSLTAVAGFVLAAPPPHTGHESTHTPTPGKPSRVNDWKHDTHEAHSVANAAGKITHLNIHNKKSGKMTHAGVKKKYAKKVQRGLTAADLDTDTETHFMPTDDTDCGAVVLIGFAFQINDVLYIIWFPVNIVEGGADGCQDVSC